MQKHIPLEGPSASRISAGSPLLFMHIPKTGGMSLFSAFAELWGTGIADLYDLSPRKAGFAAQLAQDHGKALYCGHFSFGLHEWFDRPVYYASILREPVARLASLYHYCLPILNKYTQLFKKAGGDVDQLASLPGASDFYFDFVPCLQAPPTPERFFSCPSPELDNGMVRRFSGYGLGPAPCPAHALETAKRNIDQYFSVVGLLERYPDTLRLLAGSLSLPSLAENHVNANPALRKAEKPLSPGILATVRAMNHLDIALYDWAQERFDASCIAPRAPVPVMGAGRQDAGAMPLWRAVGASSLRDATLKSGGVPQRPPASQRLVCRRLVWSGINARSIAADLDTVLVRDGGEAGPGPRTRLVFDPKTAKQLAQALTEAVAAYEQKHGLIEA